ncbi:uncharacterized protein BYT42DRAFT_564228 [Radiomyces spectabilis]|uniref:uncharacterized protein n=1 Tax=Radiomyces spectabilis TaxID=64574 RepID=UPI00221F91C0|nr:uncharacterized protein BYT42DRAFT_564228 [Radiomyces spectabilis]KAI8384963.1 hypothetical protein BYT42DRAFT_564228 [Radiomyces spectabilis]
MIPCIENTVSIKQKEKFYRLPAMLIGSFVYTNHDFTNCLRKHTRPFIIVFNITWFIVLPPP